MKLSAKSKFNRKKVEPMIEYLTKKLKPLCNKFEVVGSYRRNKPEIGDIELLITGLTSDDIERILLRLRKLRLHKKLWKGAKKMAYVVSYEKIKKIQLEIYITQNIYWPASLLTRTGNAMLNIIMRKKAKDMNLKLNEYGLFKNDIMIKGLNTEKKIFQYLNIEYHTPEERSI